MIAIRDALAELCNKNPQLLKKGGLSVALVVTRMAKAEGLPLDVGHLRTKGGGQVRGMGKAAVQKILADHGITKVLAEEGGRTSRGTLALMGAYVEVLNGLGHQAQLDMDLVETWWIDKVKEHFASIGPKFKFDQALSLRSNLDKLFNQVKDLQASSSGSTYLGSMLQHLVGAKLDLVLGEGHVVHYGANVADGPTSRSGDFLLDKVVIHVTSAPTEALVRKCLVNVEDGLRPVIITLPDRTEMTMGLLANAGLDLRVDVLDMLQFLTANVYERSLFKVALSRKVLAGLLARYNELVIEHEADPVLRIDLGTT